MQRRGVDMALFAERGCRMADDTIDFAPPGLEVRPYRATDERDWLRCRALSFLGSAYYDDVLVAKPRYDGPAIELVATTPDGAVVGIIDVAIAGDLATIETIAVHPDAMRRGIGTALFEDARRHVPPGVSTIDAWTRGDEQANRWYQRMGFREAFRYLHVYASGDEIDVAVAETRHRLNPVAGFFHADIADEATLREVFRRVHVCRRYVLTRAPSGTPG